MKNTKILKDECEITIDVNNSKERDYPRSLKDYSAADFAARLSALVVAYRLCEDLAEFILLPNYFELDCAEARAAGYKVTFVYCEEWPRLGSLFDDIDASSSLFVLSPCWRKIRVSKLID